jgi:thiamine biosynthesis lipoprotein
VTVAARRHRFRAMGTEVVILSDAGSDVYRFASVARMVEAVFEREEARFSRFRGDTELSAVNANAGSWTTVSAPFRDVLVRSLEAAARTGGLFDPTVLPALVAAGYDRDFDEVRLALLPPRPPEPAGRWSDVELRGSEIRFPHGVGLDFGGIAKGWTVDLALRAAAELPWAVVNAGGDLAVRDVPEGFDVRVEDPLLPAEEALRLTLSDGALATSSVTARQWGPSLHHLIDPRTGRPAVTDVVQATAWAKTCAEAEVGSKWALLGGIDALNWVPAILVMRGGGVVTSLSPEPERRSA